jgi:hypothetical protein
MLAGPALAASECSAAFSGPEAKPGPTVKAGRVPDRDSLPSYLQDEIGRLANAFGVPARVEIMDGAGACVNVDDGVVLLGRVLSQRIISAMKTQLPKAMKDGSVFPDHDAILRGGMRYIVAHEFAHLFQHARAQAGDDTPKTEAAFELQADCIAGLWLGYDPSATLRSGSAFIQGALATATVFGNTMGDFPTVGVPEQIDATGHSTGIKRMACLQTGIGAGRSKKFGDPSTAFTARAKDILQWSDE